MNFQWLKYRTQLRTNKKRGDGGVFFVSLQRQESILPCCCLSVCLSDGRSVHQQFSFIFFAKVALMMIKFGTDVCIQIYYNNVQVKTDFRYNRAIFDIRISLCQKKFYFFLQFPLNSFAEVAHIEIIFGIHSYHNNVQVNMTVP